VSRKTARRAAPSKDLVPVGDPLWDNQIKDTLSQVIYYTRSQGGIPTSPEVRRMVAIHAESRLQTLVAELEAKLGFVEQ
jgi:hypothetical protein